MLANCGWGHTLSTSGNHTLHRVRSKLQIIFVSSAAFVVVLVAALRVIVTQSRTIADLRTTLDSLTTNSAPEARVIPQFDKPLSVSAVPDLSPSMDTPSNVINVLERPPLPTSEVEAGKQRAEKMKLLADLQDLELQLASSKLLVPEPEDPKMAYFGAGTWITSDALSSGITKIEIGGELSYQTFTMRIRTWARCQPVDCDWGVVPLYLMDLGRVQSAYQRGFAIYEFEGWNHYLLITFQRSGLMVESIDVAKQNPAN